jgi:hypothetical protein
MRNNVSGENLVPHCCSVQPLHTTHTLPAANETVNTSFNEGKAFTSGIKEDVAWNPITSVGVSVGTECNVDMVGRF